MNQLSIIGNQGKRTRFDPDLHNKVIREYEEQERKSKLEGKLKNQEIKLKNVDSQDLHSENSLDFWGISNVPYRDGLYKVDLAKKLLDNGHSHTQDEWAEYSRQAQQQNKFYVGDFPLYHALFTALSNVKDATAEEAREFIKQQMISNYLMTLTRIRYAPKNQKDVVIHNYNQQDQYTKELDSFIGPDGFITQPNTTNTIEPLQALLDTKQSLDQINQVYNWLTGVDARIWRISSEVKSPDERIAMFVAVSVWASLNCDGNLCFSNSALGVRHAKI